MKLQRTFLIFLFLTATVIASSSVPRDNFDTAYRKLVPDNNAITSFENILKAMGKLEKDERTKNFLDFFGECMESFDLKDLYESEYFQKTGDGYRAMCLKGCVLPDRFKIELVNPDYDKYQIKNSGDYVSEYALKKNETTILGNSKSYSALSRSKTSWKQFSYKNMVALVEALFRVVDPGNIKTLEKSSAPLWCNLSGDSRPVMDEFYKSFPNIAKFLNKYFLMDSAFDVKTYNNIQYTHANIKGRFNFDQLEKDYPHVADYLEDLKDVIEATLILKTQTGHTWSRQVIKSTEYVTWDFYTRNGKLVPFDSNGNPVFEEEFSVTQSKDIIFIQIQKATARKFGLIVNGENTLHCEYHSTQTKGLITGKLLQTKGKVTGKIFGIFSPVFIDIMMPGNMDQLISDFVKVMVNANKGEGTNVRFEFDTSNPNDIVSNFYMATEMLDNFLIRLGMKISAGGFKTDEDTQEELRNFQDTMVAVMLTDIRNKNELLKTQASN